MTHTQFCWTFLSFRRVRGSCTEEGDLVQVDKEVLHSALVVTFNACQMSFNSNSLSFPGNRLVLLPARCIRKKTMNRKDVVGSLGSCKILLGVKFESRVLLINVGWKATNVNNCVVVEVEILG